MTALLHSAIGEEGARRARAGAASAAVWLGALAAAFLAARAPVLGLYPLGVALAAAVPPMLALPVCAGAALGCAAGAALESCAPPLAALLAVAAARVVCGRPHARSSAPAALGAACLALCTAGMDVLAGRGAAGVLSAVAEGLITYGAAVLLAAFFSLRGRCSSGGDGAAAAARLFALAAAVTALAPLRLGWLSAGVAAGAAAALVAALAGGERGTAAGVAVCAALALSDADWMYAGVGIAAGALAAGLCRGVSRAAASAAFFLAACLGAACAGAPEAGILFLAQAGAAALAVQLAPAKLWRAAASPDAPEAARGRALAASERLESVSRALCDVGETLNGVLRRTSPRAGGLDEVYDAAARRVCAKCPRNAACWTGSSPDAFDAFNALSDGLRRAGGVTADDLPSAFRAACRAPERVCAAVTGAYQAQIARRGEALRADAARAALVEQYGALAAAVAHLAAGVSAEQLPDRRRARRLEQLFEELGAPPLETCVTSDGAGGVLAVVRLTRMEFTPRELRALTDEVSAVCRCPFETARPRAAGTQTVLTFRRKPLYTAAFGCASAAAQDVSADVFRTAEDGRGSVHAMLCDGMGTGRAAAVGGTLAAALLEPLLCAGAGAEAAARLAGVALALEGGGEEPVAVDMLSVNLYTGAARLYKAGGAPSFLLRDGTASALGGDSLPIGSFGRVTGRAESVRLQEGDRLLLVSDGAAAMGAEALCALLERRAHLGAQALCETVVDAVRAASRRPDDVTAACLELQRA